MKRVVRSTLAAEAYAVSEAAESGLLVTQILEELLFGTRRHTLTAVDQKPQIPLIVVTDSKNLEQTVPADTTAVADKRLRIVICMLRQFFVEDELGKLQWVPTKLMLGDQLTKVVPGARLSQRAMALENTQTSEVMPGDSHSAMIVENGSESEAVINGWIIVGLAVIGLVSIFFTVCRFVWRLANLCCRKRANYVTFASAFTQTADQEEGPSV